MEVLGDDGDLVGSAKQERSVDTEDSGVVRDVFVLQDVHAAVFNVLVGDLRNRGGGCDAADEKKRSEDHARFDGDGEIGEDGESKSDEPHADVSLREFQQLWNLAPLAHVVGDDHENSGEHGQRHVTHHWRGEEKDAEQSESVNHTCDRRLSAGADVGGGAGDGAGGGESAKHGRNDVGHPLADKFDVGVMAVVAHTIGDYGRHERFDRAQHGNGESGTEQAVDEVGAKPGYHKMG